MVKTIMQHIWPHRRSPWGTATCHTFLESSFMANICLTDSHLSGTILEL